MIRALVAAALALIPLALGVNVAHAQYAGVRVVSTCGSPTPPWPILQAGNIQVASTAWLTVDTNYNLCTTGGGGGGGGGTGWTPSFVYSATLAVTGTSSNEALPTGTVPGSSILVYNLGPSGVAYTLGPNNTVTASTTNDYLAANAQACIVVPTSVGSSGYIAAKTFFSGVGAVSSLNVSLGTGECNSTNSFQDFSVEVNGETAVYGHLLAGTDNSTATRLVGATAAGTSSTNPVLGIQGVTGGVPVPVTGGGVSITDNSAFTRGSSVMSPSGCQYNTANNTLTNGNQGTVQCNSFGQQYMDVNNNSNFASILAATVDSANNNKTATAVNVTGTDCSGTITAGGTAQNAIAAQTTLHGFHIENIDTGHNDEVLWVSFTGTATALTAASYPLPAPTATSFANAGSYTTPPGFGTNHAVSILGATTGHIFSCTWW